MERQLRSRPIPATLIQAEFVFFLTLAADHTYVLMTFTINSYTVQSGLEALPVRTPWKGHFSDLAGRQGVGPYIHGFLDSLLIQNIFTFL